MFVIVALGGAVALGLGICAVDQALDGGLAVLQAAKAEGARDGIREYRDGPGAEERREAYKNGYNDCKQDVKDILG